MAINLWYDYIFSNEICNNLLPETERLNYHNTHKSGTNPGETQIRQNAILPNFLKTKKIPFNLNPSVAVSFLHNHNWNEPQFLPVEFNWWKDVPENFNFKDSHFLEHGKSNTEFLFWYPTEAVDIDDWKLFEIVHRQFPQYKMRFIHGNLKTPNWVKNKPYLNYKGFDYFWALEQRYSKPNLNIDKEEKFTFSFYNNRLKLHRAIPYYRLLQNNMLTNSDSTFNGVSISNGSLEGMFNSITGFHKSREKLYGNYDADYLFYYSDKEFKDWVLSNINRENKFNHINAIRDEKLNSLSYLDVITETHVIDRDDHFFITEKTYRSIARGCIFLVLGHKGTLQYLKSKGIQTFDDFFDESYDQTTHWFNRWKIIEKNIQKWLDLGPTGRKQYYRKNFDKLQHNQNVIYQRNFRNEIEELFK